MSQAMEAVSICHIIKPANTVGNWAYSYWEVLKKTLNHMPQSCPTWEERQPGYLYTSFHGWLAKCCSHRLSLGTSIVCSAKEWSSLYWVWRKSSNKEMQISTIRSQWEHTTLELPNGLGQDINNVCLKLDSSQKSATWLSFASSLMWGWNSP